MKKKLLSLFVAIFGLFMLSSTPDCSSSLTSEYPVFFPHPTDCSKFYECFFGQAYEQQCPSGFHFNASTMECDFPGNANCDAGGSAPADCKVGNICYTYITLGYVTACACEGDPTKPRECSLVGFSSVKNNYTATCAIKK